MTDSAKIPANVDELVAFIAAVVSERFLSSGQPTDGAVLAEKIRHRFPGFHYEQLGLLKLADAIEYAERKGLLTRNRMVKHLEIRPRVGERPALEPGPVARAPHIRPDIWRAFVFISPGKANYFDRQTGAVIEMQSSDVPNNAQLVSVPAISLAEQQGWMVEFLETRKLNSNDAPIRDPYCFTKFPIWLCEHGSGLDREWKQFRVQRVVSNVRDWAEKNQIDPSSFFSTPLSLAPVAHPETAMIGPGSHERAIRAAVIAAARNMPIEQLQEISIPIRYVLQALKGV